MPHWARGVLASAALIAAITGVVALLEPHVPVQGLAVLYLLAVLPIAIEWGVGFAIGVSLTSAAVFAVLFVRSEGDFIVTDRAEGIAVAVYVITALVVGQLGARLRRQTRAAATLADEQAALRRVATLVAQGVPSSELFEAVTREIGLLCDADLARMERYESDGTVTGVSAWSRIGQRLSVGTRFDLIGTSVAALVRDETRPVRVDTFAGAVGPIADEARALGIRSSVGCPIVVGGKVWGVIAASTKSDVAFPPETESRIGQFTELVATAVANAESRAEIAASRARIVATADLTRRRIERDLHDGAQQRLVSLAVRLRGMASALPPGLEKLEAQVAAMGSALEEVLGELREISRGIHPAILSRGGLEPAIKALARRSAVPVDLAISVEKRLAEAVEVATYYVVSEALTNAARHASASMIRIDIRTDGDSLRLVIEDDGVGGADPARGSGLIGLKDRVEAIGGTFTVASPSGTGTSLRVDLPL